MQTNSSICSPTGLDCYAQIKTNKTACLTPFVGMFADIDHLEKHQAASTSEFADLILAYEEYKRGNNKEVIFPQKLASIVIFFKLKEN